MNISHINNGKYQKCVMASTDNEDIWDKYHEDLDFDPSIRSTFDLFDEGEHVQGLEQEVADELGVDLDFSTQGGRGVLFIRDPKTDEELGDCYWSDDDEIDAVVDSYSDSEFKSWFKSLIENTIKK